MVKADAYNHGLEGVIHISDDVVDRYGVATLEEGINLRRLGINKPVSVFLYQNSDFNDVVKNRLTPVIYNEETLKSILNSKHNDFELKIDTGMNRLGFKTQASINATFDKIFKAGLLPRAVHTHFYSKDSIRTQQLRYWRNLEPFKEVLLSTKKILSASQGILNKEFSDGVRAGLIAYKNALRVTSNVVEVKSVFRGESVGSEGKYKPKTNTTVALIAGGYYDGIRRAYAGAEAVINGKKTRIVGNVNMDSTFIEVGDIPLKIGDIVTLIDSSTLESYVKVSNSTEYEVITSIKGRAKRIYSYHGQKYDKVSY